MLSTRAQVSADQKAGLIVDASGADLVRASNPDPAGSTTLMSRFLAYQAGLGLKNDDGTALNTDSMLPALQTGFKLAASGEKRSTAVSRFNATGSAAANGVAGGSGSGTLSCKNDFIDVDSAGTVTSFNLTNYLKFVAKQARLKAVPSFDQVAQTPALAATATADFTKAGATINGSYSGGESKLFGNAAQVYANFTEFGWNNNGGDAVNAVQADVGLRNTGYTWAANPQQAFLLNQYKMINALPYVGKTDGITTHWRIRVGARDRDMSFTVAHKLSRALKGDAKVKNVDYALHGDHGHAGNCDVLSAVTWIDQRLAAGH